ncbi:hypothetical protein ASF61_17160 [Duganella sp. Leaf126]|uniref:DUF6600 domain-containing protein n=1 Tax=Duganella sp. Leaf126 TaxID=1736266 RepID=UPI0006FEF018|nr:DUF6600 domain-containing protein [Duganella sp. Leaf126]KQQ30964.1 hypothetical protein ASF61_17160 [Duganella sp. Leaf126]
MNFIPTLALAALVGWSSQAQAQAQAQADIDLPAAVGRISAVQGQVTLNGADQPVVASLNWPVTAGSHLVTASGARTEFRLGSTAVRLDGDTDLEIAELDDNLLRLRLNYGSVSIRVRNADLLRDFELTTPQARITMIEPGLLRVDVERVPDTTEVSLLAGTARVDGAGSSVTVDPGRQVDITSADVRTRVARRDGFDVWADERDRLAEVVVTTQYISTGITGYEELDRHGSWTQSVEYGPLWAPRNVAADWAPYRDGRWTWLAPWGWTWVDNAPWGYAPSHYGRWVTVRQRWYWAPGRPAGRPVWAPALVGWVGGVSHPHQGPGPGLGWYPLTPRDRFVPTYRVPPFYEQRLAWSYQGKSFAPRGDDRLRDHRNGLTVLPRAQFEGSHIIRVNRGDHLVPRAQQPGLVTPVTPPRPPGPDRLQPSRPWQDRNGDGRPDRFDAGRAGQDRDSHGRAGQDRDGNGRPGRFDAGRTGQDRDGDGRPDRFDAGHAGQDHDGNGRPGRFDAGRAGQDRDGDGRPDRFDNDPRNGSNPRGDGPRNEWVGSRNPRTDNTVRNEDARGAWPRNGSHPRDDDPPRTDGLRNDTRPGRVISTAPLQVQPQQPPAQGQPQPQLQPQPQPGWSRGQGRPQTIGTLPPNQIGTPDAPAQTINPRDVGLEIRTRPNGGRPGTGAGMPAPVLEIGNTRDRFQRDDNDRRQREDEERRRRDEDDRRQRWQDRRSQQQPSSQQPPQLLPAQQSERPRFQPSQDRPQPPERLRFQPSQDRPQPPERLRFQPSQDRPQQQEQPRFQPSQDRPQPPERPRFQPSQDRPQQPERPRFQPPQERPQQQERPQPARQAPPPAAQPQPRSEPAPVRQNRPDRPRENLM